jgi:Cellulase (glycosyl hydrolase family 5)/Glycosyl hydrolase catalytic core
VTRVVRFALLITALLLAIPAATSAAPRMWMGFQDDAFFLWLDGRDWARTRAEQANSTVFRTNVSWYKVAPRRPGNAANPFDPSYQFEDIDELVRSAQSRGIEVMITIYGTPRWANRNRGPQYLPRRVGDMTNFARAVSARYSGRYPGYPMVRFYTVWNEPNLALFLRPQFAGRRSVAPALYARLYRAAYLGIKAGNPQARVGAGVTSPRGQDRPRPGVASDSHSPGRFAELVSKARPRIRFDAWAHHPYPPTTTLAPTSRVRWPAVTLTSLPRFGRQLDKWFKRKNIPLWITEYGHETRPEDRKGVTYATQARYLQQAYRMLRANPRVEVLIWFVLADHPSQIWQSGLLTRLGYEKPAFDVFSVLAKQADMRNSIVRVKARRANPVLRFSALRFAYASGIGSTVGMTYRVFQNGRRPDPLIKVAQPVSRVARDGWVSFRPQFTPVLRRTYTVTVEAGDINGNQVKRSLTVIPVK